MLHAFVPSILGMQSFLLANHALYCSSGESLGRVARASRPLTLLTVRAIMAQVNWLFSGGE